jgi:hypothetical protein
MSRTLLKRCLNPYSEVEVLRAPFGGFFQRRKPILQAGPIKGGKL